KDVEPGRGHAEAFDIAQPVVHPWKLVARGVAAVHRDDEARRDAFLAEPRDRRVRTRGHLACALQGPGPARVIQFSWSIHGDAYLNPVLLEHPNVVVVNEGAVGLDTVVPEPLEAPAPQLLQVLLGEHERLAAEEQEVRPLSLNGCLHLFQVVRAGDVAGLTLRVLVAVLAGDVALDADGPEFYRHGAGS